MVKKDIKKKNENSYHSNNIAPKDIWIILPGHNEEKNLKTVVDDVKKFASNIVFVDDGSEDNTYEIAKTLGIDVLKHITNLGKGAALKTGCDFAVKNGAKAIVVMDSDGQHEPKDIPRMVEELNNGNELVFGCRKWNQDMPIVMKAGNFGLYILCKTLFKVDVLDSQSGFRAFTSKTYKKIRWTSNDYSMESEMIARAGINKIKYSKIEIRTIYHDNYKGTTVFNGIKIGIDMFLWKVFGLSNNNIE